MLRFGPLLWWLPHLYLLIYIMQYFCSILFHFLRLTFAAGIYTALPPPAPILNELPGLGVGVPCLSTVSWQYQNEF